LVEARTARHSGRFDDQQFIPGMEGATNRAPAISPPQKKLSCAPRHPFSCRRGLPISVLAGRKSGYGNKRSV